MSSMHGKPQVARCPAFLWFFRHGFLLTRVAFLRKDNGRLGSQNTGMVPPLQQLRQAIACLKPPFAVGDLIREQVSPASPCNDKTFSHSFLLAFDSLLVPSFIPSVRHSLQSRRRFIHPPFIQGFRHSGTLASALHLPLQLADLQREVLRYKREDGVMLTATLYTPPGYSAERDGPLPALLWAYPREFKSKVGMHSPGISKQRLGVAYGVQIKFWT